MEDRRKEASKEERRKKKGVGGKVLSSECKPMEEMTVPRAPGSEQPEPQGEDLSSVWRLIKGY